MNNEQELTRKEVVDMFDKKVLQKFSTFKEFIEWQNSMGNRITEPGLSDMRHGRKGFGTVILEYLGLEKVTHTETLYRRIK